VELHGLNSILDVYKLEDVHDADQASYEKVEDCHACVVTLLTIIERHKECGKEVEHDGEVEESDHYMHPGADPSQTLITVEQAMLAHIYQDYQ